MPSAVCQSKITSLAAAFDNVTVNDAVPPSVTVTVAGSKASVAVSPSVMVTAALAAPVSRLILGGMLVTLESVAVKVSSPSTSVSATVRTATVCEVAPLAR